MISVMKDMRWVLLLDVRGEGPHCIPTLVVKPTAATCLARKVTFAVAHYWAGRLMHRLYYLGLVLDRRHCLDGTSGLYCSGTEMHYLNTALHCPSLGGIGATLPALERLAPLSS